MTSLNRVTLIGHVGKDPEMRSLANGDRVANLTLATSENWKDKSGERQSRTEWHRISIFNDRLADVVERFVKKGSQIYVAGSLQTRKWTDQSGTERYTTEINVGRFNGEILLLDRRQDGDDGATIAPRAGQNRRMEKSSGGSTAAMLDDEVPFAPCTD